VQTPAGLTGACCRQAATRPRIHGESEASATIEAANRDRSMSFSRSKSATTYSRTRSARRSACCRRSPHCQSVDVYPSSGKLIVGLRIAKRRECRTLGLSGRRASRSRRSAVGPRRHHERRRTSTSDQTHRGTTARQNERRLRCRLSEPAQCR
jgi:hypothetical protein